MALVRIQHTTKDVTTAGTRVALASSATLAVSVMIQAKSTNTGPIYIGGSTVSSTSYGARLTAGNSLSIEMPDMGMGGSYEVDLSEIYIDAGTNGEGVSVVYYTRG
jgi:hypothetical protein